MDNNAPSPDAPVISPSDASNEAAADLAELVAATGGQQRDGQVAMARAVASAATAGTHLVVEAPTGTGKSLAYLLPAARHAKRSRTSVVIATATKALQEQLIANDLPVVAEQVPGLTFALMKGRNNYACKAAISKALSDPELTFDENQFGAVDRWDDLMDWVNDTDTGDRSEAPAGVTDALWSKVSVSAQECVGQKCSFYTDCFGVRANAKAHDSDVIVTNQHLLTINAAAGGYILPAHSMVVVDEAHKLPEVASNVWGVTLRTGRAPWVAAMAKRWLDDHAAIDAVKDADELFALALYDLVDTGRIDPTRGDLAEALDTVAARLTKVRADAMKEARKDTDPDAETQRDIFAGAIDGLLHDIQKARNCEPDDVTWVEGGGRRKPYLRMAPVDVAPLLHAGLFAEVDSVVLTSATLTVGGTFDHFASESGLSLCEPDEWGHLQVDSPFDYANNALLYVAAHLPRPNDPAWSDQAMAETLQIIEAAGGRTLLLFTSWMRLNSTCEWLSDRLPAGVNLLRQGDMPPVRLVDAFRDDPTSVLAATQSFWEGVDIPGDSSVCVVIDKLPFPRRGDPLMDAKRSHAEQHGRRAFDAVDVPRAATLLAQGTGRLIRRNSDFGIVAVLDSRLATQGYRHALLGSLPFPAACRTPNLDDPDGRWTAALPWLRSRLAATLSS